MCKGIDGKDDMKSWVGGRLAMMETAEKQGRDLRSRPVRSVVGFGQTLKFNL